MFGFGKQKIKISVIIWDASFREYFHTVDAFGNQRFSQNQYEIIWVDYYNNENSALLEKIRKYPNAKLINLNHGRQEQWHLGKCVNAGIRASHGDLLVVPDGDVVVPSHLLSIIEKEHKQCEDLVVYFRRWDEPADKHDPVKSYDIGHLKKVCTLTNPTNYGGLISARKKTFKKVNNYEMHDVFSGPGANGYELYLRMRNCGLPIKWHREKIFHPHHTSTGESGTDRQALEKLAVQHPWIHPYAGINQSWALRSRNLLLGFEANNGEIESYLAEMPTLDTPGDR